MTLQPSELQRLSKLLGMMASTHDGEALVAARKAHELLKANGTTWPEVLGVQCAKETLAAPEKPAHHIEAMDLLKIGKAVLTTFERNFLIGIMAHVTLSAKQAQMLEGLRFKVLASVAPETVTG